MDSLLVIAIDGPAGSGKSSVAREVARRLGLRFLDSGAMYRAATWNAMRAGVTLTDEAAASAATGGLHVELRETPDGPQVLADGEDVTQAIRRPELTANVRHLARMPAVRKIVNSWQRRFAEGGGFVAEGRDMTTVVFTDADVKFYLDASVQVRARRRLEQLNESGRQADPAELEREIAERDRTDCERAAAPLRRAEDAVYIDTSAMTFDAVVGRLLAEITDRTGVKPAAP